MPTRKRKSPTSKRRKVQSGKGVTDVLRKIHSFVKDKKLISRGLTLAGYKPAAAAAAMAGYGRKRRKSATRRKSTTKRRSAPQLGRGIFSDIGGGLGSLASGIGHGLFGLGRKRKSGTRRRGIAI